MTDITWTPGKRRLSQLIPWVRNPRQIRGREVQRLQESLVEFGQVETIAIGPDDELYNGHQRLKAWAAKYGDVEVDVRIASRPLTEKEREKLTIYLHKGAAGEWDFDMLANEWDADLLVEWGFDEGKLGLIGDADDAGRDTEPETDRADELRQKWGVEAGQLWQLGEHRLICGDCTDAVTVARVMGGEKAAVVLFDPPWDADVPPPDSFDTVLAFGDGATMGDIVRRFGPPAWVFVWDCVSCWYTPNRPLRRMKLCAWYGDVTSYQFDGWHYGDAGEARTVWNTRGKYTFTPDPRGKHLADVYSQPITKLHAESEHSHSKPLDWVSLLIGNCTTGDIYDPFSGSGTTIIACENLGRRCRAVEISPGYVAVALERFFVHSGKLPVLISSE